MYREETLLNVIKSVTRNGRSIILTAVLALILVYIFSVVGYVFFNNDFLMDVDADILKKGKIILKLLPTLFLQVELYRRIRSADE